MGSYSTRECPADDGPSIPALDIRRVWVRQYESDRIQDRQSFDESFSELAAPRTRMTAWPSHPRNARPANGCFWSWRSLSSLPFALHSGNGPPTAPLRPTSGRNGLLSASGG